MDTVSNQLTVEFAELPGWLQVTVRSEVWTPELAADYNGRVAAKVKDVDPSRILIVRDIPVTLHSIAVFPLMSDFVEALGRRKVAVVNPFALLKEDLSFAMQIAANRGADYKLFDNVPDAEAWLLA